MLGAGVALLLPPFFWELFRTPCLYSYGLTLLIHLAGAVIFGIEMAKQVEFLALYMRDRLFPPLDRLTDAPRGERRDFRTRFVVEVTGFSPGLSCGETIQGQCNTRYLQPHSP